MGLTLGKFNLKKKYKMTKLNNNFSANLCVIELVSLGNKTGYFLSGVNSRSLKKPISNKLYPGMHTPQLLPDYHGRLLQET